MCQPIVSQVHCAVCLPPRANVLAQRTRKTHAFAGARGERRPFAKLLCTVVRPRSFMFLCCAQCALVYFMPKFFKDFTIPYYAVKCNEKMLNRHLEEMNKFFCQGVPDCVFDVKLDVCEANPSAGPTVSSCLSVTDLLRNAVLEILMLEIFISVRCSSEITLQLNCSYDYVSLPC